MRIVWHGHSCFQIGGSRTLVIDPHDGKSIGLKTPSVKADIVLVSHDHFDHNCVRVVKGDFTTLREPGRREVKGIAVEGMSAFHDEHQGAKRGKVTLFKFEMDGISFCHCGDLGHMLSDEQLKEIGKVDVLFVPVGGVFTIDGGQAKDLIRALRPKVAVPMHFRFQGLSLSIQTLEPFLEGIPERKVLRVGNEMEFEKEELPKSTEYWVFSL